MLEHLLKKQISRLEILKTHINQVIEKEINITVYRNHSFEHMEAMINKFLGQSGLKANFTYSDYDDSFNFEILNTNNNLNLIWIDFSRYKSININEWFENRINYLKRNSKSPILVYYTGLEKLEIKTQDTFLVNSRDIEKELQDKFYDKEKFEYSGTNLSSQASIKISQELGLKYIPSFFKTPIKAIVIDMDNTFYTGILGEDGINALVPNLEFQEKILNYKNKGVLLGIASKNEFEDVEQMFKIRKDFLLKWNDFSSHKISWESKADSILSIAKQFNIGLDSILFIDDNIAEINRVKLTLPTVNVLLADKDICHKLNIYPLLERYTISKEDTLRASDIDANVKREEMKNNLNEEDYFKSLDMKIKYSLDTPEDFDRAIQLLNKTNQFILAYKRFSKEDIKKGQHILTISLKDNLSDSGIIGIVVASLRKKDLYIDDLVISCRALGRNIESVMIDNSFAYLAKMLKSTDNIIIDFKTGPRNSPAKQWLEQYCSTKVDHDCIIQTKIQGLQNKHIKMEYK